MEERGIRKGSSNLPGSKVGVKAKKAPSTSTKQHKETKIMAKETSAMVKFLYEVKGFVAVSALFLGLGAFSAQPYTL
jgi:hypothetical protein